ncbi:(Fe-S)-binding protein [Paenibacillus piri]|uniref:Glycolate oxidase iron-sulfur subunit n=1 Tax=Paenibacillus piri TaxID=2547395 RepID=A0A4R5KWI0_9BACL|nr:(Fe-S)-binding protein [Paenibacillus piri]TDG00364.1 (Fe-S)-binding protein [Paenibacillus piri]
MSGSPQADSKLKELQKALSYDDTMSCIQCGYCLPACPTYETMGKETHSPRGRIHLVKMAGEGKLNDFTLLADSLDQCLGCRACETACPSGVKYGSIYESAKNVIEQNVPRSVKARAARSVLLRKVFPSKAALNTIGTLLWAYQKSGLQHTARKLRLTRVLPEPLGVFERIVPDVPGPLERRKRPLRFRPEGVPKLKVAFFTGCVMDAMFERINHLSMKLLQKAGSEVIILSGDTCCGALHSHSGEMELAKKLARQNIAAFERLLAQEPVDYIVNNAGGCGAMLVEYDHLFHDDPAWANRAQAFASRNRDIHQVLAQLGLPLPAKPTPQERTSSPEPQIVTYQRSCHMTNVQKVTRDPLQLMGAIPGIRLREMEDKDKCCGSAGIYNIVNYKESMDILDVKMNHVKATQAQTIVTTNPGCLMQMQLGIVREGLEGEVRAVHLVELLAEACGVSV